MSRSRTNRPRARIVHNGRPILLPGGAHVIGRAPSCTVVLDERTVSRRHACLRICERSASIEDLGSANGVFVNGDRILLPESLEDGDIVVIGGEELRIQLDMPSSSSELRPTLPGPPPSPATKPAAELAAASGAGRIDPFLVLADAAERALAAGDVARAEQAVELRLLEISRDIARRPAAVDDETVDRALVVSLALAEAVPSRRWLDYAIDLVTALSKPLSDRLAADLRQAKTRVGAIDHERLDAYARTIRRLTSSMHTIRTLTMIDQLKG
jgi:hypothetical protein